MTAQCPATHTIDEGDWAEAEQCELPIEHNVEGTWHEAGWKTDDVELHVRWAPEIGEKSYWPRYGRVYGGQTIDQRTYYSEQLLKRLLPLLPLSRVERPQ